MNRYARMGAAAVAAAMMVAGCKTPDTIRAGPDGKPISGLMYTEREVAAFLKKALDPRQFAITVTIGENGDPIIVNANRSRPGLEAITSFVSPPHTALPLIEGTVGGRPALILVDPTSGENWTSIERAKAFGLMPIAPPLIGGVPEHMVDSIRGTLCVAPSSTVDLMPIEAALFFARASRGPLWPLSRSADAQDADFIFGWSLLRSFAAVQWNFGGRVVVLSNKPFAEDDSRMLARVPLEGGFDALVVKGMVDSKTQRILIDLAGDFEIAVDEPTMTLVKQVSLGDVVLRDLRSSTLESHGLGFPGTPRLGLRALSRFRVVLDNRRNELVILAPTASAARPVR
ncbi:MAG: hypothetical protein KJ579_04670 [Verrucomicrobia bacterium]|nr:hypothetical protein [Verrucomicrobiota bacterium]